MANLSQQQWTDLSPAQVPVDLTHLSIDQMPRLVTTRGLTVHRVRSQLDVWNNPLLADLSAFESTRLSGSVTILKNPRLESLGALRLERDPRFGLRLEVRDNLSLTSLGTLGEPTEFDNALLLEDDPKLANIDGLRSVRRCNILRVRGTAIQSLTPFSNLETPSGLSLELSRNPRLRDLEGLGRVSRLVTLTIVGNPSLESLDGLGPLLELRLYRLVIRDNPRLRSIAPQLRAKRVEGVSDDGSAPIVELENNPLVPIAEVDELRRRLLERH